MIFNLNELQLISIEMQLMARMCSRVNCWSKKRKILLNLQVTIIMYCKKISKKWQLRNSLLILREITLCNISWNTQDKRVWYEIMKNSKHLVSIQINGKIYLFSTNCTLNFLAHHFGGKKGRRERERGVPWFWSQRIPTYRWWEIQFFWSGRKLW